MPEKLTTRAYALLSVVWGLAAFAGPMIGAAFEEAGDWRWAFYFYGAQAMAFSALAFARLGGVLAAGGVRPAMPWRVLLLAAGVIAIAQAGIELDFLRSFSLVFLGVWLIGLFVWLDGRTSPQSRMLPARAFDLRLPSGAVLVMVLGIAASTMGFITYGPLLMHQLHGLRPLETGSLLLLESVAWSIVAITFASLSDRWQKVSIAGGFTVAVLGVALQSQVMPNGPVALIAVGAIMMGGGMGAAFAFMTRRAIAMADESDRERIASAIPTMQRLGYALGAAYAGIVANASGMAYDPTPATAERAAFLIFALALIPGLIGLAAMARFLRFK